MRGTEAGGKEPGWALGGSGEEAGAGLSVGAGAGLELRPEKSRVLWLL